MSGVRAGTIGIVALFFGLFGLFYVNAQYLQDVKGYSPLLAGLGILPVGLVMPIVSSRSMGLAGRLGTRATTSSASGARDRARAPSFSTAGTPYALYAVMLRVVSAGMGLAMPPLSAMMVRALPATHAGVSPGLNGTTRRSARPSASPCSARC